MVLGAEKAGSLQLRPDHRTEMRKKFEDWPDWYGGSKEVREAVTKGELTENRLQELMEKDISTMEDAEFEEFDQIDRTVLLKQHLHSCGYNLDALDAESIKRLVPQPEARDGAAARLRSSEVRRELERWKESLTEFENLKNAATRKKFTLTGPALNKIERDLQMCDVKLCEITATIWQKEEELLLLEALTEQLDLANPKL